MTDIIIPVWNNLEYTKKCLDSVIKYTKDYNLIIIDNGSTDGTSKYLEEFQDNNKDINVLLIINPENEGFVKAINQGLNVAKNDVVLLNNDTEVCEGWLETFIKLRKEYDIIGPLSTAEHQWQYTGKHEGFKGHKELNCMVAFFCVYINKACLKDVGLLDENIKVGLGDDDDYCMRALKKGYKIGLCDTVIKHNHRTSINKIPNIDKIQKENMEYVMRKHSITMPKKILLAIPNTGNIHMNLVERLLTLDPKGHIVKYMLQYGRPCSSNRNQIIKNFLTTDFEYLLMCDSDVVPPEDIISMVDNEVDICAAETHGGNVKKIRQMGFKLVKEGDEITFKEMNFRRKCLYEVDAVGSGCILIHRRVLEAMHQPIFFRLRKDGTALVGHDLFFCFKAKQLGFKVFYDTRFKCTHWQTLGF